MKKIVIDAIFPLLADYIQQRREEGLSFLFNTSTGHIEYNRASNIIPIKQEDFSQKFREMTIHLVQKMKIPGEKSAIGPHRLEPVLRMIHERAAHCLGFIQCEP